MALITPDFSEIADEVTPGEYRVQVAGAEAGEWSTGTKYVAWTLETVGDENPKNNGRKIFHRTPISGKGAFLTQRFFSAVTGEPCQGAFDTEQLIGRQAVVVLKDGTNQQGEKTGYVEVAAVRPAQ